VRRRVVVKWAFRRKSPPLRRPPPRTARRPETDEDLLVVTADYGNDPTFRGTDHTRERVPLLVVEGAVGSPRALGTRHGFCDVGATAAHWLATEKDGLTGENFLRWA
jgi:phosphopentomutase